MTTRNRTSLFLSKRTLMRKRNVLMTDNDRAGSRVSPTDGQKSLLGGGDGGDIEMGAMHYDLPPVWVDTVEQVNTMLGKIGDRLTQLHDTHAKHLLPGFDDMEGESEQDVKIITDEISRLFKNCEAKIRFLGGKAGALEAGSNEARVLTNLQSSLALQLGDLYTKFRRGQKQYISKLQGQQQMENDFVEIDTDKAPDDGFMNQGFTADQTRISTMNEDMLKDRDQEIQNITESVEDLATLFKDLQSLVIDQGTILDRIDYNIEATQEFMEGAVEELKKAEKTQKKNKMMLCIYVLLLLCGALTMVLVFKHI